MLNVPMRMTRTLAGLVAAVALAVTPVVAQAATAPSVTHLKVTPTSPVAGKGFKVSFKTASGGKYTVYSATSAAGGALVSGTAKAGKTVTTKRVGKSLRAGKYTVGVLLTSGGKTKRATIKVTIKK